MTTKNLKREIATLYTTTFLLVLIAALAAGAIGFIAQNLYLIVAAVFVLIPHFWIDHKKLNPDDFGLTTSLPNHGWPRATLWAIAATAITIPLFFAGFYVWNSQINDHQFKPTLENYLQWPTELEGRPTNLAQTPGIWIFSQRQNLHIAFNNPEHQPIIITTDGDLYTIQPTTNTQTIHANTITIPPHQLPTHLGALPTTIEQTKSPLTFKRSYTWILLWSLTHLVFVAFPEEFFYRGYLQTRLTHLFGTKKLLGITHANLLTSVLFALGHVLIPVGGTLILTRASVFFPSIIFGWLRERTGTILAPTLYHAACNIMVLLTAPHFF